MLETPNHPPKRQPKKQQKPSPYLPNIHTIHNNNNPRQHQPQTQHQNLSQPIILKLLLQRHLTKHSASPSKELSNQSLEPLTFVLSVKMLQHLAIYHAEVAVGLEIRGWSSSAVFVSGFFVSVGNAAKGGEGGITSRHFVVGEVEVGWWLQ